MNELVRIVDEKYLQGKTIEEKKDFFGSINLLIKEPEPSEGGANDRICYELCQDKKTLCGGVAYGTYLAAISACPSLGVPFFIAGCMAGATIAYSAGLGYCHIEYLQCIKECDKK